MSTPPPQTLSVCMIVKNEEATLARCLASVEDIADEIVVVDTGSTDRTVQIAQEHGARLFSVAWKDDFSEARNVSLQHATGTWILWLDADDVVPAQSRAPLGALKKEPPEQVFGLCVRNEKPGGTGSDFLQARLFPNRPNIRFEGRIHEQMMPSALRAGLKLRQRDILIEHHGYADAEMVREKSERNISLLLKSYDAHNPDPVMGIELADAYLMVGEPAEARKWFLTVGQMPGIDKSMPEIASHAYLGLAKVDNDENRFEEALRSLQKSLELCPDRPDALYSLAVTHEGLGEIPKAVACLRKIIATEAKPLFVSVDFREATIKAYLRAERLLCGQNLIDEAHALADEALAKLSHRPEIHSMMGRALYRAGRATDSLHAFEKSLQAASVGNLDAFVGLCHIYLKAGRREIAVEAIGAMRQAFADKPRFWALCSRLGILPGENAKPPVGVKPDEISDEQEYLDHVFGAL